MNVRELQKRMDNMERLIREIHAKVMTGGDVPIKHGDPAISLAARELLNGNDAPLRALSKRRMVS
jgi:hypothetical protein